jgi:indolepyruvate ferredoxin oxidoreductase alpha subunit
MFKLSQDTPGYTALLMGNEAFARGAIEAGVRVCAAYPGTPSSEIPQSIANVAQEMNIHIEWSANEKVAAEVAAAASFAGLRSMVTMKNAGINVASDFLQHHNLSGIGDKGGGMVLVVCDDPGGHSSSDEQDTRWVPRSADIPLLVPTNVQNAKDLMKWAFELSETFKCYFIVRSYTRLSHSTGAVKLEGLAHDKKKAAYDTSQTITPETPFIVQLHKKAHDRLERIRDVFETCPFNWYEGPNKPELLLICCGSGSPCSREAIDLLQLEDSVGMLSVTTAWPLPKTLIQKHVSQSKQVLIVEETDPFIELHVKEIVADSEALGGKIRVYGRGSGHIDHCGEMTPEAVVTALATIFGRKYALLDPRYANRLQEIADKLLVPRGAIWCPGCPHRASFWSMMQAMKKLRRKGKDGFVVGDVGCYTLDIWPYGYNVTKLLHGMGTALGLGSGFGKLSQFGFDQPVIAVCGDSTFFHSSMPALINAIYNKSNMMVVVLENGSAAMTGFQPHPSAGFNAVGEPSPVVDIANFAANLGCKVSVIDPFNIKATTGKLLEFLKEENGVKVLVLRRKCELMRMREERKKPFEIYVDPEKCKGETCGICTKIFACPGLTFDRNTGTAKISEETCCGCGVCVDICPHKSIKREEVVQ